MAEAAIEEKREYNEEQKELIKVATLLQKKGLKEKEAVVNRKRIYYFRADAFHELINEHSAEILKLLSKHNKFEELKDIDDSKRLGDIMINNGLIRCFDRVPDDEKKYRYPKKLIEVDNMSMNEKGFYGFHIYKSQTKMTILAVALAITIIAVIMFPLWPYSVKIAIFKVLFYFSASMLGMIAVRLVLFLIIFPFGVDFWIFPNLFDDDAGILDSFVPFLLINVREDGWMIFIVRILMVFLFAGYVYQHAGLPLPIDETVETFNEIFEWGKDKMVGNETQQIMHTGKGAHESLDDILKMTEEYEREEAEEKERRAQEEAEAEAEAEAEKEEDL